MIHSGDRMSATDKLQVGPFVFNIALNVSTQRWRNSTLPGAQSDSCQCGQTVCEREAICIRERGEAIARVQSITRYAQAATPTLAGAKPRHERLVDRRAVLRQSHGAC